MGQAKDRGTREERIALALAWDEAHREDRERFPSPVPHQTNGRGWLAVAAMLALANEPTAIRRSR